MRRTAQILSFVLFSFVLWGAVLFAANQKINLSKQEKPIYDDIRSLRSLDDKDRAKETAKLALKIRELPPSENKVNLATGLASLSTEGDFGHDTLQQVATTLAAALHDQPQPKAKGETAYPYVALAQLARYEHVEVTLDDPEYSAAMEQLKAVDERRQQADFTLTDLSGEKWTLKSLKGKVVLLNFWATWCPPCNREMPDMQALYDKYKDQGLVVLAVTDEESAKVEPFISKRKFTYPILLDTGRKVNEEFGVEGIPKTFVFDRDGKLVAQAIDMRTLGQFLEMLSEAGVK
jgi:peroxiredoxin